MLRRTITVCLLLAATASQAWAAEETGCYPTKETMEKKARLGWCESQTTGACGSADKPIRTQFMTDEEYGENNFYCCKDDSVHSNPCKDIDGSDRCNEKEECSYHDDAELGCIIFWSLMGLLITGWYFHAFVLACSIPLLCASFDMRKNTVKQLNFVGACFNFVLAAVDAGYCVAGIALCDNIVLIVIHMIGVIGSIIGILVGVMQIIRGITYNKPDKVISGAPRTVGMGMQLARVVPSQTFPVVVPAGVSPGQSLQVTSPSGMRVTVQVPAGAKPGSTFQASTGASLPAAKPAPAAGGRAPLFDMSGTNFDL